jgi:hypothetical protein
MARCRWITAVHRVRLHDLINTIPRSRFRTTRGLISRSCAVETTTRSTRTVFCGCTPRIRIRICPRGRLANVRPNGGDVQRQTGRSVRLQSRADVRATSKASLTPAHSVSVRTRVR